MGSDLLPGGAASTVGAGGRPKSSAPETDMLSSLRVPHDVSPDSCLFAQGGRHLEPGAPGDVPGAPAASSMTSTSTSPGCPPSCLKSQTSKMHHDRLRYEGPASTSRRSLAARLMGRDASWALTDWAGMQYLSSQTRGSLPCTLMKASRQCCSAAHLGPGGSDHEWEMKASMSLDNAAGSESACRDASGTLERRWSSVMRSVGTQHRSAAASSRASSTVRPPSNDAMTAARSADLPCLAMARCITSRARGWAHTTLSTTFWKSVKRNAGGWRENGLKP
mmetsp:Transcript_20866/g.61744  ORF Transcript_20866/g.61744 Transcript_20866/m.61744 type:complete len:278 (-) Transcript_20866:957-1790(-)